MPEPHNPEATPWLSVIGVGENGLDGLSSTARTLIAQAEYVFGGARHLGLVASLPQGRCVAWPTPFSAGVQQVLALRGHAVVVLASGDPFFYGVGGVLARSLEAGEMLCLPAPSSVALACARLGWAQEQCHVVSVCGRPMARLRPFLQPRACLIVLSADAQTPRELARWLVELGFGTVRCSVMEALGGPNERCRSFMAKDGPPDDVASLNLLALDVPAEVTEPACPGAAACPIPVLSMMGS